MSAKRFDIEIDQGASYTLTIVLRDPGGNLLDLSAYSGLAQMRKTSNAASATAAFTVSMGDDPTLGEVTMSMPPETTTTIPLDSAPSQLRAESTYVYDLILTDGAGIKTRIVEGLVRVSARVSR